MGWKHLFIARKSGNDKEKVSDSDKKRIDDYLETEKVLLEFFDLVGYCKESCKIGRSVSPGINVGCCYSNVPENSTGAHKALISKREELFGKNNKLLVGGQKICGYHSKDGCRLKSHRPMLCLANICQELSEHLWEKHKISMSSFEIYGVLYRILDGTIPELERQEFNDKIRTFMKDMEFVKRNDL